VDEFDVGARLLELRARLGLSQRALAERAGVPHGQISQIEQNRVSPSVASLRKILSGLSMTMAEFFEPERGFVNQIFFSATELVDLTSRLGDATGDGVPRVSMRQVGNALAHGLQILHECYLPGADTGKSALEHNAHEGGFVIAGEIEITVGSQRRILGKGESYLFDSSLPHRFRNLGTEPAEIISACTPPYL
jgi:transcriptional regulator with XRE-family HTH domain